MKTKFFRLAPALFAAAVIAFAADTSVDYDHHAG